MTVDLLGDTAGREAASPDLPLSATQDKTSGEDRLARPDLAPAYIRDARLLVVDDEPSVVKMVAKHLVDVGYQQVATLTRPGEVWDVLEQAPPDLILLDVLMPEYNGLDLLGSIRASQPGQDLPVIIFTACSDPRTRREALARGATDFLAKPIDPHELALRVRNVLIAKRYRDQLSARADRLAAEVQRQNDQLIAVRHEAELRYLSGKSEIASEVLHNVGNALHSVTTGVSLMVESVQNSPLPWLQRTADLIEQHVDDLPQFLTGDRRGRVLPSYLRELSEALLAERDCFGRDLEQLTRHLEHINAVVATQQKYARSCCVVDQVWLPDLLDDVEELARDSRGSLPVDVERTTEDLVPIRTDRQKLIQVLLNVFKNAVESVLQRHGDVGGRVRWRCGRSADGGVVVEVSDNGIGIAPEHLVTIFSHGFTTKRNGHGFGLHSAAILARELRGTLRAQSQGLGRGAEFLLELPLGNEVPTA